MKQVFLLIILLLQTTGLWAQSWLPYNDTAARTSFELPLAAITASEDSSKMNMYAAEVDSLLGLQVHIVDSAYFDAQDTILSNALAMNGNDTLRAIAQITLMATNSTLTAIADITVSGRPGLELGIEYNDLASDVPTLTFIRYFLIGHKLMLYTISGSSDDLVRLTDYKNQFFSSIHFY